MNKRRFTWLPLSATWPRDIGVSLVGLNGAGKTTTVNVLTTLTQADGGTVRVAGHDVATGARRFPTIELAIPAGEVRLRTDMNIYGVHELPASWTEEAR